MVRGVMGLWYWGVLAIIDAVSGPEGVDSTATSRFAVSRAT